MVDLTQHSPLGGSGAARWMQCPGSVRLSYGIEDEESEYATRGKAAHALAEMCLKDRRDAWELVGKGWGLQKNIVSGGIEGTVDANMADGVQVYLNAVRSLHSFDLDDSFQTAWVELEFHCPDLHEYFWGKADFVYLDEDDLTLHVWDFKNGFIDVEVIENQQLMYYGCGAFEMLELWGHVHQVVLHICQPNGFSSDGPVREWTISNKDLQTWLDFTLIPAMDRALTSRDTASGEHCRFCPARARACPQILKDMDELERFVVRLARTNGLEEVMSNLKLNVKETAPALTDKEVGRYKDLYDVAKIANKEVDNIIFGRMMAGKEIPNRKLVKARSNRTWKGDAGPLLREKFGRQALVPEAIKSPSEVDKMIGGKQMTARHAFKPDKGLTVARSDDKRMAVDRDPSWEG